MHPPTRDGAGAGVTGAKGVQKRFAEKLEQQSDHDEAPDAGLVEPMIKLGQAS
jgi:hypothetical protein